MNEGDQFIQSDVIRDHVFPLVKQTDEVQANGTNARFLGTGFFIGNQGKALTAAHVLRGVTNPVAALLVDDSGWRAFSIDDIDLHPSEDVAAMTVEAPSDASAWRSFSTFSGKRARGSLPYYLFGYPEDAAFEIVRDGNAQFRPDLVYSEGHVRRRLPDAPFSLTGSSFLELSGVAGGGCSGSPIWEKGSGWDLIGVYIGERINDRSTSVGFAASLEELAEWVPSNFNRTLAEEIRSASWP